MPIIFPFTQGSESRACLARSDTSPLLGRFRAVPPRGGLDQTSWRHGSLHVGYGAIIAAELAAAADRDEAASGSETGEDEELNGQQELSWPEACCSRVAGARRRARWLWQQWVVDLCIAPRQGSVQKLLNVSWYRYAILVGLPSAMAVGWCALPIPKSSLNIDDFATAEKILDEPGVKAPGHGAARAQLNFWFFLLVYYGLYNLVALVWITKLFNLYSLNWWPRSLGFPLTFSLILLASLGAAIPTYLSPTLRFLTTHNTAWITWTFVVMALPLAVALLILTVNERHLGPRISLSDTQRIFTTSWWTGEHGSASVPRRNTTAKHARSRVGLGFGLPARRDSGVSSSSDELDHPVINGNPSGNPRGRRRRVSTVTGYDTSIRAWIPASFVRFLWFCIALFVGLMAYVIGEVYAEIYLRTLPHNDLETIIYVYSWVVTVHLLDGLTGWILGSRDGERVGSYPLSWVFKLYFMLTYQTYVRALYARLRSPQQFILLQVLSSSSLIILTPVTMSAWFHRVLTVLGLCGQSYASYQKLCLRNAFIRTLAENASMAAFLGSVLVLHFGANKDIYPYFAFDDPAEPYDFRLTFYASCVTWACELAAGLCVRALLRLLFVVDIGLEGTLDLAVWPELLPTSIALTVHVLQNMLFSIVRLQF